MSDENDKTEMNRTGFSDGDRSVVVELLERVDLANMNPPPSGEEYVSDRQLLQILLFGIVEDDNLLSISDQILRKFGELSEAISSDYSSTKSIPRRMACPQ